MIRQAISCDICGTEKKQTNHWFVAQDQGGELRLSGLNLRNRLRPGTKHLCGHTCLHKLVDDFISRALAVRPQADAAEDADALAPATATDTRLTSSAAYANTALPSRLATPPTPQLPDSPPLRALPALVAMTGKLQAEAPSLVPDEPLRFASRNWRSEAWERERERELRAIEQTPNKIARRRTGS